MRDECVCEHVAADVAKCMWAIGTSDKYGLEEPRAQLPNLVSKSANFFRASSCPTVEFIASLDVRFHFIPEER